MKAGLWIIFAVSMLSYVGSSAFEKKLGLVCVKTGGVRLEWIPNRDACWYKPIKPKRLNTVESSSYLILP